MEREAYAAARTVTPRVRAYFERRHAEAMSLGQNPLATLPESETIEAVIDAAFWASLRSEEGYTPRISLALLSPEEAMQPLVLERPLRLSPAALAKVAPAVERAGIHLGVWQYEGELHVWGTTRIIPRLCFVLEVAAPGLLVIKHHGGDELGKFANVAVLQGDQIKVVDERASNLPDCPALVTSLLGFDSPASWGQSVLVQLAVSMRAHGRGGCVLVVPAGLDAWRESIVQPISYAAAPPFSVLARLSKEAPERKRQQVWQEELSRAIEWVAGLTAVDGAMILTDKYEMLGFGAKITRRRGWAQIDQVTVTEPIQGAVSAVVHPEKLGGTRHLSAAQFVHDQHDAVALVASQDGRFTIFEWPACESMVHAHRVDALLL
jgi:hypothetical protein